MLSPTLDEQFIPLLVTFPIGKLWARYVPNVTLFGVELNPGPFTIKEHVHHHDHGFGRKFTCLRCT